MPAPVRPNKSFRQVKSKSKEMRYDQKEQIFYVPDEFGYTIKFKVNPFLAMNTYDPFQNGVPEYQTNIVMQPMNIEKDPNGVKDQKFIHEYLKDKNIIPTNIEYEYMTLGFVYGQASDPNNYKWMFEFRRQNQMFYAMHFVAIQLKHIDIGTYAWADPDPKAGFFHGRFSIQKEAIKTCLEDGPNKLILYGKQKKHEIKGDISIIPKDCTWLKFRYNTKTDIWYTEFMNDKNQTIAKPVSSKKILGENVTMRGDVDWEHPKPKVTTSMKVGDVNEIRKMADTLIVVGR